MVRLTRVQQQARTRTAVLAAAADEFREHGFADAKIDRIAARADLTRGAVYSNFPSKRALYLAVLLDAMPPRLQDRKVGPEDAAAEFGRAWIDRLPLAGDSPADGRLRSQSLAGVFEDEPGRTAMTGIAHVEALLLATVLDHSVRRAALLLTFLHGAREVARSAPGFGDPFDVVAACRHLVTMDVPSGWDPPYLPFVKPAQRVREPWTPPAGLIDVLTGRPADLTGDGLVTVLGSSRLTAAEETVRSGDRLTAEEAARPRDRLTAEEAARPSERPAAAEKGVRSTIVIVTADPAETGALIRLRIAEVLGCLPETTFPFQLVHDEQGAVAAAIGVEAGDDTEAAVRIRAGEITARATGRGAAHAAAGGIR